MKSLMSSSALLAVLVTLFSCGAHASRGGIQHDLLPKVNCSLDYSQSNPDGTTGKYVRGPSVVVDENGAVSANNGFIMTANFEQICAADGGPCANAFRLFLKISQVQIENFIVLNVQKGQPYQRYSTGLVINHEDATVSCDVGEY